MDQPWPAHGEWLDRRDTVGQLVLWTPTPRPCPLVTVLKVGPLWWATKTEARELLLQARSRALTMVTLDGNFGVAELVIMVKSYSPSKVSHNWVRWCFLTMGLPKLVIWVHDAEVLAPGKPVCNWRTLENNSLQSYGYGFDSMVLIGLSGFITFSLARYSQSTDGNNNNFHTYNL